MSLLDTITHLRTGDGAGSGAYEVTRTAAGTTVKGRFTPGAPSSLTIEAVVQPFGGELQVAPEGRRVTDVRVVHTATELLDSPGGPDVITIDGEAYAVYNAERWELRGQVFWRCYVARQVVP